MKNIIIIDDHEDCQTAIEILENRQIKYEVIDERDKAVPEYYKGLKSLCL